MRCLTIGLVVATASAGAGLGQEVVHEIHEIQGRGLTSPRAGEMVRTNDNVVTAVGAGGFFIQTPSARSDGDADTSDGIFVLHDGAPPVDVRDRVDVTGTVEEFFGFTRIDATVAGGTVRIDGSNPGVAPCGGVQRLSTVSGPRASELPEGVRVLRGHAHPESRPGRCPAAVSTSARIRWPRCTSRRRLRAGFREPGIEYPGRPGLPVWDGNPEVFELDPDKLGLPNVSWVPGTTFTATGVLGYEFGGYEIWPTELMVRTEAATLPRAVRAKKPGEITVASQNLLNLRGGAGATKLAKLSRLVREVLRSPDIVAVQEAGGRTALQNLATRIRSDDSNVRYTAHLEAPGSSQSVGFLVRSGVTVGRVTEHGRSETFVDPRDGTVDRLHDRPPVVLEATAGGLAFSVVVIHNRSLIDVDDAARGEWVRTKRLEQAQSVARLVESLQDSRVIVLGDFNAFPVHRRLRRRRGPDQRPGHAGREPDVGPGPRHQGPVQPDRSPARAGEVLVHLRRQRPGPGSRAREPAAGTARRGHPVRARQRGRRATQRGRCDDRALRRGPRRPGRVPVTPKRSRRWSLRRARLRTPVRRPTPIQTPIRIRSRTTIRRQWPTASHDDVLCLGHFDVQVEWRTSDGRTGRGMAEKLTAESGYFWFFEPANIEMVIKVLDGCAIDGHFWVFAAGLTDVEVTTTVHDRRNGARKTWASPLGRLFEPIRDTGTFDACEDRR